MYLPRNRSYSSRHSIDSELKKSNDRFNKLVKIVAWTVILIVLVVCGVGAIVTNVVMNYTDSMSRRLEALEGKQDTSDMASRDYHGNNDRQLEALNNTILALQEALNRSALQVAFFANEATAIPNGSSSRTVLGPNRMFQHVEMNIGNGYNESTSFFTAPVAGLYLFSVTVVINAKFRPDSHEVACSIIRNRRPIALAGIEQGQDYSASVTTFMELDAEDVVGLGCTRWNWVKGSRWCSFAGALIKVD